MATHDYVIANGTGSAVRSDLNNALAAIVSNNSSSSEPSTKYAYQWWADTTTGQLKLRNSANNGWVTIFELDGTMLMEDGTVSAPGLAFASDLNTGFYRPNNDQIGCVSNGQERVRIGTSEVVFNEPSNDVDFRVESNGNTHMLFVDAGNDRVGIGTSSPTETLTLNTASGASIGFEYNGTEIATINNNDAALYVHAGSGKLLSLGAGGSESMRIDSSGRVGIGISDPDAYYQHGRSLVVGATGANSGITIRTGNANQGILAFADGVSGGTQQYAGYVIYDHSNDNMLFATGAAERMRIDSSGRLLVGASSSRAMYGSVNNRVQIEGNGHANSSLSLTRTDSAAPQINLASSANTSFGLLSDGGDLGIIAFMGADGSAMRNAASIFSEVDGTPGTNDMPGRLVFSTTADGASSPTERMRIRRGGEVLVGRGTGIGDDPSLGTTQVYRSGTNDKYALAVHHDGNNSANYGIYVSCGQDSGNGFPMRIHDGNGTLVGSISFSGSSTAFNTSSDYRLKENVVGIADGITRVKQLSPRRFNFIADADTTVDGFLAHEAQAIVPEAVTGTHDEVDDDGNAVMQGIDQSKLVPLLTAALQEAIAKIETLETKVAALEAG